MMAHIFFVATLTLGVFSALGQEDSANRRAGAKELFQDPYGNSVAVSPSQESQRRQGRDGALRPHGAPVRSKAEAQPKQDFQNAPGQSARGTLTDSASQVARNVGLRYWIELVSSSDLPGVPVTTERVFKSGERIRLHFQSNVPGHVALLQLGTTGAATTLFPDPSKGYPDNRIGAMEDRVLPGESAWFRFDDEPGAERILVLFAQRAQDIRLLATTSAATLPAAQLVRETVEESRSSKSLVLEDDIQGQEATGTYVVNVEGGPVVFELVLRHS